MKANVTIPDPNGKGVWTKNETPDGKLFYYNMSTKESKWPQEFQGGSEFNKHLYQVIILVIKGRGRKERGNLIFKSIILCTLLI